MDGISLAEINHAVESVGDDKYRSVGDIGFHILGEVACDIAIGIIAEDSRVGQFTESVAFEAPGALLVGENKH